MREEIRLRLPGSATGGWSMVIQTGGMETSLHQRGCGALLLLGDVDRLRLSAPESEGVYFEIDLTTVEGPRSGRGNQSVFRYYIEKDFPCIHPRAGDAME